MSASTTDLTIRKSVSIPLDVDGAFELFTAGIANWWPTATHSIHGGAVAEVVLEERAGGELYERSASGEKAHWATVLEWEPPHRLVLEWRVNPTSPATEVTVRFAAEDGGTRVDLEHGGWERFAETAASDAGDYDVGWDVVLGRYAGAAAD